MKRRKNSILAALELLRERHPNLTTSDIRVFASIAKGRRELTAIAQDTGLSKETVSRCARSFLSERSPFALAPRADLLSVDVSRRNNRTRLFVLNEGGEAMRAGLNRLIEDRRPIVLTERRRAEALSDDAGSRRETALAAMANF